MSKNSEFFVVLGLVILITVPLCMILINLLARIKQQNKKEESKIEWREHESPSFMSIYTKEVPNGTIWLVESSSRTSICFVPNPTSVTADK